MNNWLSRCVFSICFGALVALVLPFGTYLANASAYGYSLARLAGEQSIVALVIAALVFGLLGLDRLAKGCLAPVLVFLLVMAYVESCLLSFGLPEINGELPDSLAAPIRKLWDGAVWVAVIALAYVFRRALADAGRWIALAIVLLGSASLFDSRSDDDATTETRRGGYELSADIIDNIEYSKRRNVLLFVLDNVDAHVATDLVAADSALAAAFPGFVACRNNIGMHDSTKLGVPGIMTGRFFEPGPGQLAKYILSVYGEESALKDYVGRGDSVYAMFCTCSYGYTTANIPADRRRVQAETKGLAVTCRTSEVPYLSLADAALFRALPFAFKRQFLSNKLRQRDVIWNVDQKYDYEDTVFPILASRPMAADPRQMFLKIHTHGAHPPYLPGITDYRAATSNALVRLSELFAAYRSRGIYDNSFIAVVADHGRGAYTETAGEPPKLRAMLWTKAEGDNAPFAVNETPTSHARLATLLKTAAATSLARDAVADILRDDHRFYRQRDPDDRHGCIDWDVDAAGKAKRREK